MSRLHRMSDAPDAAPGAAPAISRRARSRLVSLGSILPLLFAAVGFASDVIPSDSMYPTLRPGDHTVTMRAWLAYPFGTRPHRGDIITFKIPAAALNGQTISAASAGDSPAASAGANGGRGLRGFIRRVRHARETTDILIKRVVGLPGDSVEIRDGRVYVNGEALQEDYKTVPAEPADIAPFAVDAPFHVPAGDVFVLGDNRPNSDDSRYWGPLNVSQITGKFLFVLFHVASRAEKQQPAVAGGN